jgi:hypothetical protein
MKSQKVAAIAKMPRLSHFPNKLAPFDISNSEVVQWLLAQPEIQLWIFNRAKDSRAIRFDGEKWEGVAANGLKDATGCTEALQGQPEALPGPGEIKGIF